ncbi:type II toxin-antitoxin system RelE/ParE family toxin [Owenweeksia hongkongensis]|uniref:type II toxin-antitoxin system RelE/ParE family toxin n=1 Tax=Owenweeksia hongkongensis TaxID=253245 RepID=UPI003A9484AC
MSYEILITPNFKREFKRLAKKYSSLKNDLSKLIADLKANPTTGTHLGNNIYKIRLAISSNRKGKSGGARVITFVQIDEHTILLFSIYSKSDKASISDKEIRDLIKNYLG